MVWGYGVFLRAQVTIYSQGRIRIYLRRELLVEDISESAVIELTLLSEGEFDGDRVRAKGGVFRMMAETKLALRSDTKWCHMQGKGWGREIPFKTIE